jgi:hypothetical protein
METAPNPYLDTLAVIIAPAVRKSLICIVLPLWKWVANRGKYHLIAVNQGDIGMSRYIPTFLELIFELHALDIGIDAIEWE